MYFFPSDLKNLFLTAYLFTYYYYIKGFKVTYWLSVFYLSTHSFPFLWALFGLIFLSFLFFYFILLIICYVFIILAATPEITMSILDWLKSKINLYFYHHQEDVGILGHFNWIYLLLMFFFFFFFLNIIYLFIYFWLFWVFVSVWGLSPVAASGGHSSSRCVGLSLSRPLSLRSTGSRRAGPAAVAHGPSCSAARGIFPDQGPNPRPLHRQADSQPLHHQGSPLLLMFYSIIVMYFGSPNILNLTRHYNYCYHNIFKMYLGLPTCLLLLLLLPFCLQFWLPSWIHFCSWTTPVSSLSSCLQVTNYLIFGLSGNVIYCLQDN